MNWDDLRVLLAAVRTGSFTAAAKQLGMDQSTVSRRISALEETLGTALFLRTREGLRPTPAAEALQVAATRVEREVAAARGAVSETSVLGTVRVATTEAFATLLLRNGLGALTARHPGLVVEVLAGNQPVDLVRGEADLSLRIVRPRDAELKARKVGELIFALCGAPAYLAQRKVPHAGDELAGHDAVVPCAELAETPEAKWLLSHAGLRVTVRCNSMPGLAAAVAAGAGLGVLPISWREASSQIQRLFVVREIPPRPIWLVTHPGTQNRPAVRAVAEMVAQLIAQATALSE